MAQSPRPKFYVLVGHRPVPLSDDDLLLWAADYENLSNRMVAQTHIGPAIMVSTVFLGLDHNFSDTGPPVLFETMVFNGLVERDCWRCSTWEEAEAQHELAVRAVKDITTLDRMMGDKKGN